MRTLFRFLGSKGPLPVFLGFVILILLFSSFYTIDQGERGVILRFGQAIGTASPGLNFKMPFIDSIETLSVRTERTEIKKLQTCSRDIQGATIVLSINYSLDPGKVADIYTQFGGNWEKRVIIPQILSLTKDAFGQYAAMEIVRSREKLVAQILGDLQGKLSGMGIRVESVQIENIDFSDEYEKSVEERMKAEVEVTKVQQNLEREKINADMLRTKAQGEADAKIMTAKAEAETIRLRGMAEAEAIKAKAAALAQNPSLVQLIQAEKWNGALPATMIPSAALPILNTGK